MWSLILKTIKKCILVTFVFILATVTTIYAGGFEAGNFNGEAVVNSARITASNPAGLALLDHSEIIATGAVVKTNVEFNTDSNNTVSGSDGGDQGDTIMGGGFSIAHKINQKLGLGLALTSPTGGSMDPDDDWVGRYLITEVDFIVVALTAALGYQVNDQLALGAGISVQYADFEQKIALATGGADGVAEIDADDTAPGFTLGAVWMPTQGTKIGIAYRSEVEYELSGDLTTSTGLTTSLNTDYPLPQRLLMSISQKMGKATTLIVDVGWTDFSEFDFSQLNLEEVGVVSKIPRNWDDTYRFGLAIQHRLNDKWGINAGITYDTSPMDDKDRLPDLPIDRQISLSTGLSYAMNEKMTLSLGYNYLDSGDAKMDITGPTGTRLSGEYDDNQMHLMAFNIIYRY
jgi:long-chain fatty acid transport protein